MFPLLVLNAFALSPFQIDDLEVLLGLQLLHKEPVTNVCKNAFTQIYFVHQFTLSSMGGLGQPGHYMITLLQCALHGIALEDYLEATTGSKSSS